MDDLSFWRRSKRLSLIFSSESGASEYPGWLDNSRPGLSCPKNKVRLFFCDHYEFSLPPGHKFPLSKYAKLRAELSRDDSLHREPSTLAEPQDILRVHSADYLQG